MRVGSGGLPCMAWCDRVVLATAWCSPSLENTTMSRMRAVTRVAEGDPGNGEQCGAITSPSRLRHVGHLPLIGAARGRHYPAEYINSTLWQFGPIKNRGATKNIWSNCAGLPKYGFLAPTIRSDLHSPIVAHNCSHVSSETLAPQYFGANIIKKINRMLFYYFFVLKEEYTCLSLE